MYSKLGIKITFTVLFVLSAFGGCLILFLGESYEGWMPIFVIIAKFGVSGGFVVLYICMSDVFPTLFCATAFGVCNVASRFLTIFSPEVAEQDPPLPMALFTGFTVLAAILIHFVKTLKM